MDEYGAFMDVRSTRGWLSMMIDGNPRMDVCITINKWIDDHPLIYIYIIYIYIHMGVQHTAQLFWWHIWNLVDIQCTFTCICNIRIYIYIYRKGRCKFPVFPRFWECSVFATSYSIIYVHIPVMVVLEIHTDCQTSSGVAKECPESHEDPQGKGRRKNKHSVCIP